MPGAVIGHVFERFVADGNAEAVAELAQRVEIELLHRVGGVLGFGGGAEGVALDGLGENHCWLARGARGLGIGGVDLEGVVPAAVQAHDVLVGEVLHHVEQARILAEEVLAGVFAAAAGVVLVFAVDNLVHALLQDAVVVGLQQRIPVAAPDHLDNLPAGAAEHRFEFLDDFAVAAHRAVEPLQIAVDDEDQIVEFFPPRLADGAEGLRLVHLAIAEESPDLAVAGGEQAAAVEVFHDVGLVDRLNRPQPHGNRGKLPIIGHQPGMGIGG